MIQNMINWWITDGVLQMSWWLQEFEPGYGWLPTSLLKTFIEPIEDEV